MDFAAPKNRPFTPVPMDRGLLGRSLSAPYAGAGGKHKEIQVNPHKGKYTGYRFPHRQKAFHIAVDATLKAAVRRQGASRMLPIRIEYQDLLEKVCRNRAAFSLAFIVDNSWSAHADKSLHKIKELVFSLLKDARFHRDRVSLVAFQHSRAPRGVVVLPPTRSYVLAYRRLQQIPLCGSTPLADAMLKALRLLQRERRRNSDIIPILAMVTDGIPTFPLSPRNSPEKEVLQAAKTIGKSGIATVVIDTLRGGGDSRQSCTLQIARNAGGQYLSWEELTRENLFKAVGKTLGRVGEKNP